ncbi:hypothetical protein [Streptomyces sp. SM1]|uniref:hypothetical protein n=1 Tax=Streptomyces sp. SM1 TaxID=402229 RepID=UPI001CA5AD08|nr:hypothetical protein [Streptomyces sp. SM1]
MTDRVGQPVVELGVSAGSSSVNAPVLLDRAGSRQHAAGAASVEPLSPVPV